MCSDNLLRANKQEKTDINNHGCLVGFSTSNDDDCCMSCVSAFSCIDTVVAIPSDCRDLEAE